MMRPFNHPAADRIALTGLLYALSDPVRLAIVRQLDAAGGELSCTACELDVAKSTLSHHFRILREAGLIYSRKAGTQHLNSLRREELEQRFPGLLDTVLQAAARSPIPEPETPSEVGDR